ncbi:MAG: hypothetical protein U1D35_00555, partial [Paracoccaceae bacterium]|nr:hypothetical protein [Paracoccaceae bacterium]
MRRRLRRAGISLRLRLSVGAGVLATLAVIAALLAAFGVRQALWLGDEAAAAQHRIDAYATLSARITEVVLTPADRRGGPEAAVAAGFSGLDRMIAEDVAAARQGETDLRARQGLALVRLHAAFDRLSQDLRATAPGQAAQDAALNNFAQVFSPLMRDQIENNRRRRDAALLALETLRNRMVTIAVGVALVAPAVLLLLYLLLIRPLVARLSMATRATGQISADKRPSPLALGPRDELALLFARVNQMTARLDRRSTRIAADRAQLETLVTQRTSALAAANARLARTDEDRRRFFADVS